MSNNAAVDVSLQDSRQPARPLQLSGAAMSTGVARPSRFASLHADSSPTFGSGEPVLHQLYGRKVKNLIPVDVQILEQPPLDPVLIYCLSCVVLPLCL